MKGHGGGALHVKTDRALHLLRESEAGGGRKQPGDLPGDHGAFHCDLTALKTESTGASAGDTRSQMI